MPQFPLQQLYIHGHLCDADNNKKFTSINPNNGEVLAYIQHASESDVNKAVESAQKGQRIWAAMSATERARILLRAVDILRERNEILAHLETLDTGKPLSETLNVDITTGADVLEYYAGLAATIEGEQYSLRPDSFFYTRREPLGITAGIGAWNYPIQIALWKSAPALAAGNAMIFKPSEITPLSALKLAEIYTQAGLPDGVFNVLQGGAQVGQWLTEHPAIEKISFTGSVETGKKVMASAAASSLKEVTMELGGKSPLLIMPDADIDLAADIAMMANFFSSGQVCTNGTRIFIHQTRKEEFEQALLLRIKRIRIGDPNDPQTNFGPLVSFQQLEKVLQYIQTGQAEGAKLLSGGKRITEGNFAQGAWVEPTIFTDCADHHTIVREEIFGPVMSLLSWQDEEEVIQRANNTHFGLAAGIVTPDLAKAHHIIQRLEAGICWINTWGESPAQMPVGGYKQSGVGRENGLAALTHYTRIKAIQVEMAKFTSVF